MDEAELFEHIREAWRQILLSGSKYGKITIDLVSGDPRHVAVEFNVVPEKYLNRSPDIKGQKDNTNL